MYAEDYGATIGCSIVLYPEVRARTQSFEVLGYLTNRGNPRL